MKMKIKKLDKDQIVAGLVAHVEKFVFGLFALLFLMLCWAAIKQTPYDKRPEEFRTTADQVRGKVEGSTFDATKDVPPVKELPEAEEVPNLQFVTHRRWSEPVFEVGKRRPEPKFLPLVDVRVATGYGALSMRDSSDPKATATPAKGAKDSPLPHPIPGGKGLRNGPTVAAADGDKAAPAGGSAAPAAGSMLKGKQWAVITGLVPLQSQSKEYRAVFRDARHTDANLDSPHYTSFQVERAEVSPGTVAGDNEKWQPVDVKASEKEMAAIIDWDTEAVDQVFTDPVLTQKLPRIIGKDKEHGKSILHPKIPLGQQERGEPRVATSVGLGSATPGGRPAGGGFTGMGGSGGLRGATAAAGGGVAGEPRSTAVVALPKHEYLLFRFFDFTVQPGKTYAYRVKLILNNPNHAVPSQYLTSAQLTKGLTREAPWSEPSPAATIPRGADLLVGSIKRASGLNDQKMEVVVRMWEPKEAVDAARTAELVRGQLANFAADDVAVDGQGGPSTKRIAFQTDTLVVDMAGGDSLPGGGRVRPSPSQMLVLEPNGQLAVKSEMTDSDVYEPTRVRLKEMQDALKPAPSKDDSADDEKPRRRGGKEKDDYGVSGLGGGAKGAPAASGGGLRAGFGGAKK